LPTGTQIQFNIQSIINPTTTESSINVKTTLAIETLTKEFPALRALIDEVNELPLPPNIPTQNSVPVPQTGNNVTTDILFFIAALRGGDIKQFVGERILNQLQILGKQNVVDQARQEFTTLRGLFVDPPNPQWQMLALPFMYQGALEHVHMFFKQEEHAKNQAGKGRPSQRFVVDVELSELGKLQFDGLVNLEQTMQKKRHVHFDLVIRSLKILPSHIKRDIRQLFVNASEASGMNGTIQFQTTKAFPFDLAHTQTNKPIDTIIA
jgi:hypothetical protein